MCFFQWGRGTAIVEKSISRIYKRLVCFHFLCSSHIDLWTYKPNTQIWGRRCWVFLPLWEERCPSTCCLLSFWEQSSNCSSLVSMVLPSFWRTWEDTYSQHRRATVRTNVYVAVLWEGPKVQKGAWRSSIRARRYMNMQVWSELNPDDEEWRTFLFIFQILALIMPSCRSAGR